MLGKKKAEILEYFSLTSEHNVYFKAHSSLNARIAQEAYKNKIGKT